jgi:RNA-binding protein
MNLSEAQKRFLRGLGHKLKPVVVVGGAGISDALLNELDTTIRHHELIKIRIRGADREQRDAMIDDLCSRSSAALVSRTGHTAVLYRRNREAPRIQLPAN